MYNICIIAFHWNHNATLALLAAYHTMQPDKEKNHKHFWQHLAKELQTFEYNISIITFYIYFAYKSEILHGI